MSNLQIIWFDFQLLTHKNISWKINLHVNRLRQCCKTKERASGQHIFMILRTNNKWYLNAQMQVDDRNICQMEWASHLTRTIYIRSHQLTVTLEGNRLLRFHEWMLMRHWSEPVCKAHITYNLSLVCEPNIRDLKTNIHVLSAKTSSDKSLLLDFSLKNPYCDKPNKDCRKHILKNFAVSTIHG